MQNEPSYPVQQIAYGDNAVQISQSVVHITTTSGVHEVLVRAYRGAPPPGASPAEIIPAAATAVPYLDRDGFLQTLLDWVNSPSPFETYLIGGPGGSGKTRLALEVCLASSSTLGFPSKERIAGLLVSPMPVGAIQALCGIKQPRVIVIDYAENRANEIARLLPPLRASASPENPVRVLLLVREPSKPLVAPFTRAPWKTPLISANHPESNEIITQTSEIILEDRPLSSIDRIQLFQSALASFSILFKQEEPVVSTTFLESNDFSQPLMVTIAALLKALEPAIRIPDSSGLVFEELVRHETNYWELKRRAEPELSNVSIAQLGTAVALAALSDASSAGEARDLLSKLSEFSTEPTYRVERVDSLLISMYRSSKEHHHTPHWSPIEPDRLAEYLVATRLSNRPESITAVLRPSRGPGLLFRPLTVLSRILSSRLNMSESFTQAIEHALEPLVKYSIKLASSPQTFTSPSYHFILGLSNLIDSMTTLPKTANMSEWLSAIHPENEMLSRIGVAISGALVRNLEQDNCDSLDNRVLHARQLADLASRLKYAGLLEQSIIVSRNALSEYGQLRESADIEIQFEYAGALANYGAQLSDAGQHAEALQVSEEAYRTWAQLYQADRKTASAGYMTSLNNSGVAISRAARDGLVVDELIVSAGLRLRLALTVLSGDGESNTEDDENQLAMALSNSAPIFLRLGFREDALSAAQQSVQRRRRLRELNPAKFAASLAHSLWTEAFILSHPGNSRTEALTKAREAQSIFSGLQATGFSQHKQWIDGLQDFIDTIESNP